MRFRWSSRHSRLVMLMAAILIGTPAIAGDPTTSNPWSRVAEATSGTAESIGGAANGCLAGAVALPADGAGYAVIRLGRRRYYGHPDLVDFVESLGRRAVGAGLPQVTIGDMAQARGGPLPFGHASHQTGLDADIWFTFGAARENPNLPSMLLPGALGVDPARFGVRQVTLLKLAATDPRVDRIFVNPAIKLALCHGFGGATRNGAAWLRLLRPWWGHDDHFHVRLRCPQDSPACLPQAVIPAGDGCDAGLEAWLHPKPTTRPAQPKSTEAPSPRPPMPAACAAVLNETR